MKKSSETLHKCGQNQPTTFERCPERSVPCRDALTSGKQRGDHAEKVKQLKSEAAPAAGPAGPPVSGVTSMEDPHDVVGLGWFVFMENGSR